MKKFDWEKLWKIVKNGDNNWLDFVRFMVCLTCLFAIGLTVAMLLIKGYWWFPVTVFGFLVAKAIYESVKFVIKEYKNKNKDERYF